ncbi:MAG: DUF898 domain-containing protein [Cellvibrionaceae bacterium]
MADARYNVVLSGAVQEGFHLEQVQAEFARIFKLTEEKVEAIFASGDAVIKKDATEEAAQKILAVLERIGAVASLQALHHEVSEAPEKIDDEAHKNPNELFEEESSVSNSGGNDGGAVAEEAATDTEERNIFPFRFYGNGGEYFRIWIVNILLTILTLGIYSAWAKVRNAQYFYGNTELDGNRFAYLAKPLTILKGRIIAVIAFVIYMAISNLYPIAGVVIALAFMIVVPWIVVRSLKFNMRMTAWRNVRFDFNGSIGDAAMAYLAWPFFAIISLGLLFPLAIYKQMEYIVRNTYYGTSKFDMQNFMGDYYIICLKAGGLVLVAGIFSAVITPLLAPIGIVLLMLGYFYGFIFFTVRSVNMMFSQTTFSDGFSSFESSYQDWSYGKMLFMNSLLTALTLGLYLPWAMVRVAHYKADHLQILSAGGLDSIAATEQENVSALGEELGDVFDLGVGL